MLQHGQRSLFWKVLVRVQCFYSILYALLIFEPYHDAPSIIVEFKFVVVDFCHAIKFALIHAAIAIGFAGNMIFDVFLYSGDTL